MTTKPSQEMRFRMAESIARNVKELRDLADEMATFFGGCDDPHYPWPIPADYDNWLDFIEKVARPLVEAVNQEDEQDAMRAYRAVPPIYICTALVMAANRIAELEGGNGQ